jgi:hypothetical protein
MARQKTPSEWIFNNGNLKAGQRLLIIEYSGEIFFGQIKNRRRKMKQIVYNPQKGRLETIDINFTDRNTTWFDNIENNSGVSLIADFKSGMVIAENNYSNPVLIYDISRSDINHNRQKAEELKRIYTT